MTQTKRVVGLALGGGAAKGYAHIGVIQELERMGAPIDVIAGTSIGALIGGWYAVNRDIRRVEESVRLVEIGDILGIKRVSPVRSGALFDTRRLEEWLDSKIGRVKIEELEMPFAAVASNIRTGERKVLSEGLLVKAIMASIAVPGVFPPVLWEGELLVDGGLVEPVPLAACRELGATAVLGVDLSSDVVVETGRIIAEKGFWRPWQFFNLLYNVISIMEHQLVESQRKSGDIILRPKASHIMPMQFSRIDEGIEAGREEVRIWEKELAARLDIPREKGFLEELFGFIEGRK